MSVEAALALVMQLLSLFPTIEPAVMQAITDFQNLFSNGAQPTQADIDALITRVTAQSQEIQSLS